MPIPFLVMLAIMAGIALLGEILRPKPKIDSVEPGSFKDFDFPTVNENRPRQWFCGSVVIDAPEIMWTGDFHAEPIRKKIRDGLMHTQTITIFHQYHVGMQFGLGHGPGVHWRGLLADDLVLWEGDAIGGQVVSVEAYDILGGNDAEGGIAALCEFYDGSDDQPKSEYLKAQVGGHLPRYNNLCHVVWRGASDNDSNINTRGYVGNSKGIKQFKFRLFRAIDNLGVPEFSVINGIAANPAEAIYELMTMYRYALPLPATKLRLSSFQAAAEQLHTEGLGVSITFDNQRPVGNLIEEILSTIGGVIYRDQATKEYVLSLTRLDYDPDDLREFTSADIEAIENFTAGSTLETTNQVSVPFVYVADGYRETSAQAKDTASVESQSGVVAETVNLIGVCEPQAAAMCALRELALRATPLKRFTLVLNRRGSRLYPNDVIKVTWDDPDLKFEELVCRVVKGDNGTPDEPQVRVSVVEDLITIERVQFFAPPIPTTQPGPGGGSSAPAVQTTGGAVFEAPHVNEPSGTRWFSPFIGALTSPALSPIAHPSFFTVASPISSPSVYNFTSPFVARNYDLFGLFSGGSSSGDDFVPVGEGEYTPTGSLITPMTWQTGSVIPSVTLTVDEISARKLASVGEAHVRAGANHFLIDGEWMAYEGVTLAGFDATLTNVYRGLMDTVPADHEAGAQVWFLSYGAGFLDREVFDEGVEISVKFITRTATSTADPDDAEIVTVTGQQRALRPIVAGGVEVAGAYPADEIPATGDVLIVWKERNRLTQTGAHKQSDTVLGAPEAGTTYTLLVYDFSGALIRTVADIVGASYTYTNATELTDFAGLQDWLTFRLFAKREGLSSWQAQTVFVHRPGATGEPAEPPVYAPDGVYVVTPPVDPTAGHYEPLTDGGEPPEIVYAGGDVVMVWMED